MLFLGNLKLALVYKTCFSGHYFPAQRLFPFFFLVVQSPVSLEATPPQLSACVIWLGLTAPGSIGGQMAQARANK